MNQNIRATRQRFLTALEAGCSQDTAVKIANGQEPMPQVSGEPALGPSPELKARIKGEDDTPALRAEYSGLAGKKPFGGWDSDTLREKIAALREQAAG